MSDQINEWMSNYILDVGMNDWLELLNKRIKGQGWTNKLLKKVYKVKKCWIV